MNRKKPGTIVGVIVIVIGLLVGVFTGCTLVEGVTIPFFRHPQGGFTKPDGTVGAQPTTGPTTSPTTDPTIPVGPVVPTGIVFTAEDALLATQNTTNSAISSQRPDLKKLVLKELDWNLSGSEPTVLIIHTHGTEAYQEYAGTKYNWRTQDKSANMIAVGDYLAALLTQSGISVLHDRELHDYPSYNDAYGNSRTSVQAYLKKYPTIQVVIDLHRDAVLTSSGSQWAPTVTVDGQKVAKLMMVVGANESGGVSQHQYQENMAAALKVQVLLEKQVSGITRSTMLKKSRYNQDLLPGSLLVEVGTAGNSLEEAMRAVPYLANALVELMYGANRV